MERGRVFSPGQIAKLQVDIVKNISREALRSRGYFLLLIGFVSRNFAGSFEFHCSSTSGLLGRKLRNNLRLAIVEHLEVFRSKLANRMSNTIVDDNANQHELYVHLESRGHIAGSHLGGILVRNLVR